MANNKLMLFVDVPASRRKRLNYLMDGQDLIQSAPTIEPLLLAADARGHDEVLLYTTGVDGYTRISRITIGMEERDYS